MIASPYTNKIFKEFLYFQRSPLEIFVLLLTTTLEWCFILGEQRITWHYLTLVTAAMVTSMCRFAWAMVCPDILAKYYSGCIA